MSTLGSRSASESLRNLPPTTLGTIILCVSIHVIQFLLGWNQLVFTMCPRLVLFTHEYYRVFSSVFFHLDLMHIGMNMLTTFSLSTLLEKKFGTLRLFLSIWWAILLNAAMYLLIAYLGYAMFGYERLMNQHALGYSGILFYFTVLESRLNSGRRSLFGFISVPSWAYPWVFLVGLQIIMPQISFMGHLVGILTGNLEYYGFLDVLYVRDSFLVYLESLPVARRLVELDTFVSTSSTGGTRLRAESSPAIVEPLQRLLRTMKDRVSPICGRRLRLWTTIRRSNSDVEVGVIRPPEFYDGSSLYATDSRNDDDEEHVPLTSRLV